MFKTLETYKAWDANFSISDQQESIQALEGGKVIFFPNLPFILKEEESFLLQEDSTNGKAKNISYNATNKKIKGVKEEQRIQEKLQPLMANYFEIANRLVKNLFPHYASGLIQGRTSFRPVDTVGRKSSWRKDDSRLHVDAFPSMPLQGQRILRVFTNVNPDGLPRVWRLGESFPNVAARFLPSIKTYCRQTAKIMQLLKITKKYRTHYDHIMLNLHDQMKGDQTYQEKVEQETVELPAGSTWIVFSDQVSHAAMSGQYLFEQTFYLPIDSMQDKATSPLAVLEKLMGKSLC